MTMNEWIGEAERRERAELEKRKKKKQEMLDAININKIRVDKSIDLSILLADKKRKGI